MLGKHLKFIDSFQFMSTSLDKLVSNLPKEDLQYTSEEFTGNKLSLMSQKACIHTITWIALKNSAKRNHQLRMSSLASLMTNILQIGNTTMEGKFGKPSTGKIWVNTMTYTLILIYMGYFDNLFYMGGKKPPHPRSNSGI